MLVVQSCPTLCDPIACSLPGSSVHGMLQARITGVGSHSLLWRIFPTQRSNPGLLHCRQILYHWIWSPWFLNSPMQSALSFAPGGRTCVLCPLRPQPVLPSCFLKVFLPPMFLGSGWGCPALSAANSGSSEWSRRVSSLHHELSDGVSRRIRTQLGSQGACSMGWRNLST